MVIPVFKPDYYIFSYNEQPQENLKKFYQQVFIVSHLLETASFYYKSILTASFAKWLSVC